MNDGERRCHPWQGFVLPTLCTIVRPAEACRGRLTTIFKTCLFYLDEEDRTLNGSEKKKLTTHTTHRSAHGLSASSFGSCSLAVWLQKQSHGKLKNNSSSWGKSGVPNPVILNGRTRSVEPSDTDISLRYTYGSHPSTAEKPFVPQPGLLPFLISWNRWASW